MTRITKRLLRGPRAWHAHRMILRYGGSLDVRSDALRSLDYNPTTQVLNVAFSHGGAYAYRQVPRREVRGLLTAESRGRYFVHNIRNNYDAERLDKPTSKKRDMAAAV